MKTTTQGKAVATGRRKKLPPPKKRGGPPAKEKPRRSGAPEVAKLAPGPSRSRRFLAVSREKNWSIATPFPVCVVCKEVSLEQPLELGDLCRHVLRYQEGDDIFQRACWIDGDEEGAFGVRLERAVGKDAWLQRTSWVPIQVDEVSASGYGWEFWFAVPVSLFQKAMAPRHQLEAMLRRAGEAARKHDP